jgi:hypothetical protein
MAYIEGHEASAASTAAVVLLVELIYTLVEKNVLTGDDVRAMLTRQAAELQQRSNMAAAKGALRIIENDVLPRFQSGPAKDGSR